MSIGGGETTRGKKMILQVTSRLDGKLVKNLITAPEDCELYDEEFVKAVYFSLDTLYPGRYWELLSIHPLSQNEAADV